MITKRAAYLNIASVFLFFTNAVCAQNQDAKTKVTGTLIVQVLLYSGRPDPEIVIDDASEVARILNLVNNLPRVAKANEGKSGDAKQRKNTYLGYRGLLVKNQSSLSPNVRSFIVDGDDVCISSEGSNVVATTASERRKDTAGSIENKLLEKVKASGKVPAVALQHIEDSRARSSN